MVQTILSRLYLEEKNITNPNVKPIITPHQKENSSSLNKKNMITGFFDNFFQFLTLFFSMLISVLFLIDRFLFRGSREFLFDLLTFFQINISNIEKLVEDNT